MKAGYWRRLTTPHAADDSSRPGVAYPDTTCVLSGFGRIMMRVRGCGLTLSCTALSISATGLERVSRVRRHAPHVNSPPEPVTAMA